MKQIHKSAIVENGAIIGNNVTISSNCYISSEAKIGDNTILHHGACVYGDTEIGKDNEIFSYSVLGSIPQDLKYNGEKVKLIIGDNNTIREFTLFNAGTEAGGSVTKIGNSNLFMGYVHIAHDCIIGDNCILANAVTLGGHVEIDDFVVIGGLTPIHQFVKIGEYAMIGGGSVLTQDIPPYTLYEGNRAYLRGLNLTGLRRKIDRSDINKLKEAYKKLFLGDKALKDVANELIKSENDRVKKLAKFVLETKRGIPFKRNINE